MQDYNFLGRVRVGRAGQGVPRAGRRPPPANLNVRARWPDPPPPPPVENMPRAIADARQLLQNNGVLIPQPQQIHQTYEAVPDADHIDIVINNDIFIAAGSTVRVNYPPPIQLPPRWPTNKFLTHQTRIYPPYMDGEAPPDPQDTICPAGAEIKFKPAATGVRINIQNINVKDNDRNISFQGFSRLAPQGGEDSFPNPGHLHFFILIYVMYSTDQQSGEKFYDFTLHFGSAALNSYPIHNEMLDPIAYYMLEYEMHAGQALTTPPVLTLELFDHRGTYTLPYPVYRYVPDPMLMVPHLNTTATLFNIQFLRSQYYFPALDALLAED